MLFIFSSSFSFILNSNSVYCNPVGPHMLTAYPFSSRLIQRIWSKSIHSPSSFFTLAENLYFIFLIPLFYPHYWAVHFLHHSNQPHNWDISRPFHHKKSMKTHHTFCSIFSSFFTLLIETAFYTGVIPPLIVLTILTIVYAYFLYMFRACDNLSYADHSRFLHHSITPPRYLPILGSNPASLQAAENEPNLL